MWRDKRRGEIRDMVRYDILGYTRYGDIRDSKIYEMWGYTKYSDKEDVRYDMFGYT